MSGASSGSAATAHAPTVVAGGASLALAAGAVLLVGAAPRQTTVLGVVLLAVVCLASANAARGRERAAAWSLGAVGVGLLGVGGWLLSTAPLGRVDAAVLVPGAVGVLVVGLALVPVWPDRTELLATAGVAFVFVAVLVAGVTQVADRTALLAATVGAVAAWDGARYAATLSRQVGRAASTALVEAIHVGTTLSAGAVVVGLAELVWRVGATDLPLVGLLALLGAALALLATLYG